MNLFDGRSNEERRVQMQKINLLFFSFSPQGIGSFESQTGIYIGEWKRGLQNGNGTAIYNNGNRYIGQFKDGFKSGYGKFQVNTIGDVYEGEFRNGLRNGQVSLFFYDAYRRFLKINLLNNNFKNSFYSNYFVLQYYTILLGHRKIWFNG